jgi:glycosyltransferase involved in cell wall biosynthesis
MPEVSIITINLNNKDGLEKTIASVIHQTFTDYEYIVIDGNSTDGSIKVIQKYADKISKSVSEPDSGIYNAMNKGLRFAKGKYCLFLNSGDYLYAKDTLSQVFAANLTSDIIYGNMIIEKTTHEKRLGIMPEKITLEHMIKDTLWHPVSFIKLSLFDKYGYYREDLKIVSDYDFFIKTIIVNEVSSLHIDIPIAVFPLDGISSILKNVELIKLEREKVQLQYFDKSIIDDIKLKLVTQSSPVSGDSSLINKVKKWFRS